MWDEKDTTARWIHGICSIPLFAWAFFGVYVWSADTHWFSSTSYQYGADMSFCAAAYFGARCAWYAITGRNCLNRDY